MMNLVKGNESGGDGDCSEETAISIASPETPKTGNQKSTKKRKQKPSKKAKKK